MSFVDFKELKERVSIEDAVKKLSLKLKPSNNQLRGACPRCNEGGDRALAITPSKNAYFCFSAKAGGDQIALVAHIRDCSAKEAAQFLAGDRSRETVPESAAREEGTKTLTALSYLQADHELVVALGFDTEFCAKHGIGYAPKGLMRGTVAIPFRDEHGTLLGYVGVESDVKLPADFTPNVVSLERRRA